MLVSAGQKPLDYMSSLSHQAQLVRSVDIRKKVQRRITKSTQQKGKLENFRVGKRCQNHSKGMTNNFRYIKKLT